VKGLLIAAAASVTLVAQVDTQALPRMVATERAFAAATEQIGVRDGFLTFFGDDAVSLDPGATGAAAKVSRAKDGLVTLAPAKLPVLARLMWEPFTGQMSDDGTLGWLTGPYVVLNQLSKEIDRKGAYFSVWKRQADGTYRVWLDEGITLPNVWTGASEFRAAPAPDAGTAGAQGESLDDAERAVAAGGEAWVARLAASMRLHREGVMPMEGRDLVRDWASAAWTSMKYTPLGTERAASGDLGVTLGGYDATSTRGPQHGTWVRVWHRDVTNRWRIVFETSKQTK
jgi:ketosteroid isomerase-like protein